MKPNLFIVGAPKCGTTAWAQYLSDHPGVRMSTIKEPHYFCTDFPRLKKVENDAAYWALFQPEDGEPVVAEASASYLYSREAAANLRRFSPDAKIIIFVRDRPGLLFSWHNQLLYNRVENRPDFETAWRLSGRREPGDHGPACDEESFLDYRSFGLLADQVDRYFDNFPSERILVIHLKDWSANPRAAYLDILRFLGLDDDGRTQFARVNEARASKSKAISLFFRKPPRFVSKAYRFVRRLTGWDAARLSQLVVDLNSSQGYKAKLSPELRREIKQVYATDQARLAARLWLPEKTGAPPGL